MGIDFAPAHATFPLSFQSVDPAHPPRLQSPTTLHPYVRTKKINLLLPGGCEVVPLAGPIRYLSLPITIFLGMWLVFSNAQRNEPHTATLAIFDYTSGVSQLHNPARCPYISAGIKVSTIPICSRAAGNHSTSTVPI